MSHSDRHFIETCFSCFLQDFVDQRDGGFGAFETEALLAHVFCLQERFERFGLVQLREHSELVVVGGLFVGALEVALEPATLFGVLDVHVFDADCPAVGIAQHAENFPQKHRTTTAKATGDELTVQIPEGQSVGFNLQVGV
ncbi:MAG: Uncharacterised protein [Cellulomonadaceae bacterium TMED98]|nr:MAG: Uncharacterised protein [Cellulomonadaceae bacterium TMED98]